MQFKRSHHIFCTIICLTIGAASYATDKTMTNPLMPTEQTNLFRDTESTNPAQQYNMISGYDILKVTELVHETDYEARTFVDMYIKCDQDYDSRGSYPREVQVVINYIIDHPHIFFVQNQVATEPQPEEWNLNENHASLLEETSAVAAVPTAREIWAGTSVLGPTEKVTTELKQQFDANRRELEDARRKIEDQAAEIATLKKQLAAKQEEQSTRTAELEGQLAAKTTNLDKANADLSALQQTREEAIQAAQGELRAQLQEANNAKAEAERQLAATQAQAAAAQRAAAQARVQAPAPVVAPVAAAAVPAVQPAVVQPAQAAQPVQQQRLIPVATVLEVSHEVYANQPAARISVKRAVAGQEFIDADGVYNRFLQRVVDRIKANM